VLGQGLYIRGLSTSPSRARNNLARSSVNFREDASGDLLGFLPTLANTEKMESDQRDSTSSEFYGERIHTKIARLLRCCRGRRAACGSRRVTRQVSMLQPLASQKSRSVSRRLAVAMVEKIPGGDQQQWRDFFC
jgi:hypothetical protein